MGFSKRYLNKEKIINVYNQGLPKLIQFIEKEAECKLWDVGNIDIMREFSFINLSDDDSSFVLNKFKELNPRKPLIVEAKRDWASSSSGSSSGWYRWGSSSNRWGSSRGWYRWNSSKWWFKKRD